MENSKIAFKEIISDDAISIDKIECSKCRGSGNFKTPENSRRTCLVCFGKGYRKLLIIPKHLRKKYLFINQEYFLLNFKLIF